MYVDEDQWARAYEAALNEVELLVAQEELHIPCTGKRAIAIRIATAAVRAAAAEPQTGDITEVPGVHIDEIASRPPVHRHRDRSERKV